jgi:hypothetical protein
VSEIADVDSITVCKYDLMNPGPGLVGVYEMTGARATDELRALRAAPFGGGPDKPSDCMDDDRGDSAVELHLRSGDQVHTMYVFYSTCHGNGLDDGTRLRELTPSACMPLFHEPVTLNGGWGGSMERCMPPSKSD